MRITRWAGASGGAALVLGLTAALVLTAAPARADLIGYTGSQTVTVPPVPGNVDLTLEVNGQTHEFESVDDSVSGTLTLSYAASQAQPQLRASDCAAGGEGATILLQHATPSTRLTATWTAASGQVTTLGPIEMTSGEGSALASVCLDEDEQPDGGEGGGDPTEDEETAPCDGNQGRGTRNGNGKGTRNGNGNGNAYGHRCH